MNQTDCRYELERLIKQNGKGSWEQGDYKFNFKDFTFYWKKRPLILEYSQALHLYQRLVLGKRPCCTSNRQALYTMRFKFGDAFLQEVICKNKSHKGSGRPSEWN